MVCGFLTADPLSYVVSAGLLNLDHQNCQNLVKAIQPGSDVP